MSAIAFDTLAFANRLKNAGQESKLAEVQAEIIAELLHNLADSNLATKADIYGVKVELKDLKTELMIQIQSLKTYSKDMELRLCTVFFKLVLSAMGFMTGFQTLLHFIR